MEDSGGQGRTVKDSGGQWRTVEDSGGQWRTEGIDILCTVRMKLHSETVSSEENGVIK